MVTAVEWNFFLEEVAPIAKLSGAGAAFSMLTENSIKRSFSNETFIGGRTARVRQIEAYFVGFTFKDSSVKLTAPKLAALIKNKCTFRKGGECKDAIKNLH